MAEDVEGTGNELMGVNIMGGQAVGWWPGGGWEETVCHHSMTVHGVGGQAGWPDRGGGCGRNQCGLVGGRLWVVVECSVGGGGL